MRIAIRSAALVAALLLPSLASAAIVEEFRAVDWDGVAYTNDTSGDFTHCTVYAKYENGATLFFSYDKSDVWYFGVMDDRWNLEDSSSHDMTFKVDRHPEATITGSAYNKTELEALVAADDALVREVRNGNQLNVSAQGTNYEFELSNSNKALDAAQECVERHVAANTRSEPVTGQEDSSAQSDTSSDSSAETDTSSDSSAQADTSSDSSSSDSGTTSGDSDIVIKDGEVIGFWEVSEVEKKSGDLINCTAYGSHGDDQLILSYFPDGVWTFGLYRPAWNLDTNQTYYLWYNVDAPATDSGVIKRPVEAATAQRIYFEVSDLEDIMERIEAGSTLNLQVRGITGDAESFSYPLDRVGEAFAAARKCVSVRVPSSEQTAEEETTSGETSTTTEEDSATEDAMESESGTESETSSAESTAINEPRRDLPELGTKVIEEFEVPGWQAAAFALDDDTFTHCGIKAEYQNGATFGAARTVGGELLLVVKHGDFALSENSSVSLSYAITGGTSLSVLTEGSAAGPDLIITNVGSDADRVATLKSAQSIVIDTEGKTLDFDISDIGPGVDALEECISKHMAAVEPPPTDGDAASGTDHAALDDSATETTEPAEESSEQAEVTDEPATTEDEASATDLAATSPTEQEEPLDPAAISAEAAGFTTALLFRSGYPNHIIVARDATASGPEADVDAKWQLGNVEGLTWIKDPGTPAEIEGDVGNQYKSACSGTLQTLDRASDATHSHFTLVCEGTERSAVEVVVVPRESGGSYVFSMSAADNSEAETIAKAVYEKAVSG